jgi:hypothetical protein
MMKKAGLITIGGVAMTANASQIHKKLAQEDADHHDHDEHDHEEGERKVVSHEDPFMKIASLAGGHTIDENGNHADCCVSLDMLGEIKAPTKAWVCGDLKSEYEASMSACQKNVDSFFHDIGFKYECSIDIEKTQEQINKMFDHYCGEEKEHTTHETHEHKEESDHDHEEEEETKEKKEKKEHDDNGKHIGQGEEADDHDFEHKGFVEPEGGNHDVEDHADQYEKQNSHAQVAEEHDTPTEKVTGEFKDLYEKLMVPIVTSWRWCNHQHAKAHDIFSKRQETEKANEVSNSLAASRTSYKALVKSQMDPRRLALKQIIKYTLHESELTKMNRQFAHAFQEVENSMTSLNHGDNFCSSFEKDFERISHWHTHHDRLQEALHHAIAHDGKTGISLEEIDEIRGFIKNMWRLVHKNFNCHMENHPDDDAAWGTYESLRTLMVKPSEYHSVFCHINMLKMRVDYRTIYLTKRGEDVTDVCVEQLEGMKGELSKLDDLNLLHKKDRPEVLNHVQSTIQDVFTHWNAANDDMYVINDGNKHEHNHTVGSTLIRKNLFRDAASEAASVYYWFYGRGEEASKVYHGDEVHGHYGQHLKDMADDFGDKCMSQVRKVTELLTPLYMVTEPTVSEEEHDHTAMGHDEIDASTHDQEHEVEEEAHEETEEKKEKVVKEKDNNGKHIGQGEDADEHDFEHKDFVEPENGNHDVEDHADQYAKTDDSDDSDSKGKGNKKN